MIFAIHSNFNFLDTTSLIRDSSDFDRSKSRSSRIIYNILLRIHENVKGGCMIKDERKVYIDSRGSC